MISIIVNCYNLEKYIAAAIDSLLNQDFEGHYEIIVINDASSDKSLEILQGYRDEKLKILNLPVNKGARYGVEEALKISTGDYICRFDGDDVWPPHFLSTMFALLDTNPEISMVYSDVSFIDEDGKVTSLANNINRPYKNKPVLDNEFIDILHCYYINAPTIMFRRSAFEKAFPLPEQLNNFIDYYISLKVLEQGRAFFYNKPMAFYRIHPNNGHKLVVQNKNNEKVTEYILNELVLKKDSLPYKIKKQLAAINYFRLGNDYFSARMFGDAGRYYKKTASFAPLYLLKPEFLKRLILVALGPKTYARLRSINSRQTIHTS